MRGGLGDLVFRSLNGQTILSGKPDFSGVTATEGQAEQRERFKQAVAYGRMVLTDPEARAVYEEAAERKGKPAFALTVADFMNAPSVDEIDLSDYGGAEGDPIYIRTHDDISVVGVTVSITDGAGTALEDGSAELDAANTRWIYTAKTAIATGTNVRILVTASDRPDGQSTQETQKAL